MAASKDLGGLPPINSGWRHHVVTSTLLYYLRTKYTVTLLFFAGGDVELEMYDVAVLHRICFTLLAIFTRFFHLRHTLLGGNRLEVVVSHHLSLDETPLEVAMYHPRSLRRR